MDKIPVFGNQIKNKAIKTNSESYKPTFSQYHERSSSLDRFLDVELSQLYQGRNESKITSTKNKDMAIYINYMQVCLYKLKSVMFPLMLHNFNGIADRV